MMNEHDMGSKAPPAPVTRRERHEPPVEPSVEPDDACIPRERETANEAKRVQGGPGKAVKGYDGKAQVRREGTTAYVMRRG